MTRPSYQRGHVSDPIRTRAGIAFRIRYRIRKADGKWTHKSETLHQLAGKKEALGVLGKRIREATNRLPEFEFLTLAQFIATYWRPYLDRRGVKPSTRRSYESGLTKYILPALGEIRVADIAPLHIEGVMTKRLATGVSTKTARNVLALLQSIFSLAVDMDLVGRSPVRKSHKPKLVHREKPVWTGDQVRAIVEAVPRQYRALFVCAALTGARLGELLGLQWKHIDLERRTLEIKQSLWNGQLLPPKTESSVRRVYFGDALKQALLDQQGNSGHRHAEAFVFCKVDGTPLSGDLLRRDVLYPALDRLQIPRGKRSAGFHTFRHSAASFINAETGNLKLAQRLLGHSTLDMTANVYTHTAAEAERGAALALERAIYGDLFQICSKNETWNKNEAVN